MCFISTTNSATFTGNELKLGVVADESHAQLTNLQYGRLSMMSFLRFDQNTCSLSFFSTQDIIKHWHERQRAKLY